MVSVSGSEPTPKAGFEGLKTPDRGESPIAAFERVAATIPLRIAIGAPRSIGGARLAKRIALEKVLLACPRIWGAVQQGAFPIRGQSGHVTSSYLRLAQDLVFLETVRRVPCNLSSSFQSCF
jgi:hypothetical protein